MKNKSDAKKKTVFGALIVLIAIAGVWLISGNAEKPKGMEPPDCVNLNDSNSNATDDFKIYFKSRKFVPPQGLDCALLEKLDSLDTIHVIMQFKRPLPDKVIAALQENKSVYLMGYLPNRAYFAKVPADAGRLKYLANLSFVRWIGEIQAEDKMSEDIRNDTIGNWSIDEKGNVFLQVMFFKDITTNKINSTIEKYGTLESGVDGSLNAVVASFPKNRVRQLAEDDAVMWIESLPRPEPVEVVYNQTFKVG